MGKIDFTKDALVFFENEAYRIIKTIGLSQVMIQNEKSEQIITTEIDKLSSKRTEQKTQDHIDNYSEKEWKEAKKRYKIIKDLVFIKRSRKEVEEIGKRNNQSAVTIYSWIKIYEQTSQISSLIPKTSQRGKRGSRLNNQTEAIVQEILEELYLSKQRYGFRKIYNKIARECKKLQLEAPHENTIRNRIDAINPKEALTKRYGHKVAKEKFSNFEGEFPEGNYPMDVVQIDHTPLDIIVVDKIYRKPLGRPYLTLALDTYSRMIAGVYISLQAPGYFNVSQCLLSIFTKKDMYLQTQEVDGEWNIYGLPRVIHVDNGADLVSSDMQRVCDEYGITLLKRPVARPQFGAHVERVLGSINKEVHNLSGTTFSNTAQKADYNSQKEATFTLEELTQWLTHYIVNIYHKKYHHGIDMSPEDKYIKGIIGDDETAGTGILPPIIDDLENIKISLLPTYHRTIQKDGISLDGITYYSDVLRHWIGIADETKNKIQHKIKRDPLNIQKIFFYDPEIKEYFDVPYRKMYAPVMTLWDLYAVKRYLKEKKISNYSEDDLFEAYELLEKMERDVANTHKKQTLRKSKPPRTSQIKSNEAVEKEESLTNDFDSLFDNIEIFEVTQKEADND
ncbi:MAG: DDE-type integrase/transposase/recombinase [Sulfurimonas sp.]|uniref:Mu transposase C-terminal domain-containing protein n=1 Tax=Sulfurimonas sp. TaxID=2022749 RepID=UPI003D0D1594